MAKASPIFGILSLLLSLLGIILRWWLGIAGIVLGLIGLGRKEDKTLCTIGIIIGFVAIILQVIGVTIHLFD